MKSVMTQLLEKGEEKGIEKGEEKKAAEVTKTMLIEGDPIPKIARVTGLSEAQIRKLKSQVDKD